VRWLQFSPRKADDEPRALQCETCHDDGNENVGAAPKRCLRSPKAASSTAKLPMTSLREHSHTDRMLLSPRSIRPQRSERCGIDQERRSTDRAYRSGLRQRSRRGMPKGRAHDPQA
jgi:hypothetical protein